MDTAPHCRTTRQHPFFTFAGIDPAILFGAGKKGARVEPGQVEGFDWVFLGGRQARPTVAFTPYLT